MKHIKIRNNRFKIFTVKYPGEIFFLVTSYLPSVLVLETIIYQKPYFKFVFFTIQLTVLA